MLWKFRVSEVVYLVLSLGYVLVQGYYTIQFANVEPSPGVGDGSLIMLLPFFIFYGIHIFFGVVELVLFFLQILNKNKALAMNTFITLFFYLIPPILLLTPTDILQIPDNLFIYYFTLNFHNISLLILASLRS